MITVADAVEELLTKDELASESLGAGLLNLSAYADKIHQQTEKLTFKKVRRGTIVVALSRLTKQFTSGYQPLKPEIKIENVSVKAPLTSLVYDKTADIQRRVSVLNPFKISISDLFSVVESEGEITLFVSDRAKDMVRDHMGTPKIEIVDLVAVTAHFAKEYASIPNFLYVLFAALASKRINIVEVVSTYTEISFIVDKKDMEETVRMLNVYT